MNEPMRMTQKLADTLMDALACVAISAIGTDVALQDSKAVHDQVTSYARDKFREILGEWENEMCQQWEIFDGEKNPRF